MKLVGRCAPSPAPAIDPTRPLVEAIAQELWRLYGRNGTLDWAGAELHLGRIVRQARNDLRDSRRVPPAAPARPPMRLVGCTTRANRAGIRGAQS